MSAVRRAASLVLGALAVALVSAGCGRAPVAPVVGTPVVLAASTYFGSEVETPTPVVDAVALDVEKGGRYLVVVRLSVGRGEVDCAVRFGEIELARRRVTRLGDDLVILPFVATGAEELVIVHSPRTGPLELDATAVSLYRVGGADAEPTARAIREAFEAETGRVADPAVENLVANPDFAADDEVRGTPADWYAYVDTSYDAATHTLRVEGAAPERRPFLATGPIPVEAGRRYRATWRMAVARGAVVVRATDYDELATVFAEPPAEPGSPEEAVAEFTPPDGVRAVRLRFEGTAAGSDTAFGVSVVQVEALPAR